MKSRLITLSVILLLCTSISGCELLCQAGTGTCGMSREQAAKLLNPKSYGEYWTKPGMTKESWRQDWVACGGMSSGQYSGNAPNGATTKEIQESQKRERKNLDTCMSSKGYTFSYTTP